MDGLTREYPLAIKINSDGKYELTPEVINPGVYFLQILLPGEKGISVKKLIKFK